MDKPNNNGGDGIGMPELEEKFVTRRECKLKDGIMDEVKTAIGVMQGDVSEIKQSISSIATWMEEHNKTHDKNPGGWKKAQTYAVIASVLVASLSLLTSTVFGIITIVNMTGKP